MKHIIEYNCQTSLNEYLSTKVDQSKIDKLKLSSDLIIPQNLIDKYDFKFKTLKTGNIEMTSNKAKFNGNTGLRFMFYLFTKKGNMCLRRQYAIDAANWSNPPANMGEFNTVEAMCKFFVEWAEKKLSL